MESLSTSQATDTKPATIRSAVRAKIFIAPVQFGGPPKITAWPQSYLLPCFGELENASALNQGYFAVQHA